MLVIGLTGGIGTGKSTSCRILRDFDPDLVIIDADLLSHEATKAWNLPYILLRYFILPKDCFEVETGALIRSKLADLIFAPNPKSRALKKIVERLIHPWVIYRMLVGMIFCWLSGEPRVVLDIPLLFEAKLQWLCSKVVLIDTISEEIQISRIMKRNLGMTEDQVRNRINSQMPLAKKRALADSIIHNDVDLNELKLCLMKEFPRDFYCRKRLAVIRFSIISLILITIYMLVSLQIK